MNLKNTFCTLCLRDWRFHAKLVFFFNLFSGYLHFDTLIVGPFSISLVMCQTLGESRLKRFFLVCQGRHEEFFGLGGKEEPNEEVCQGLCE